MYKSINTLLFLFLSGLTWGQAHYGSSNYTTGAVPRHQVVVGGGGVSLVAMAEGVRAGEDGYDSRPISRYSGTFTLAYSYQLSHRFAIGICLAWEKENGDMRVFVNSSGNGAITDKSGSFKRQVITIAPELRIEYPREDERTISIYGYFGLGVSFLNELDTYSLDYYYGPGQYTNGVNRLGKAREFSGDKKEIAFQLSPLGLSVGHRLFAYAEVGFGYKGVLNCGIGLKL